MSEEYFEHKYYKKLYRDLKECVDDYRKYKKETDLDSFVKWVESCYVHDVNPLNYYLDKHVITTDGYPLGSFLISLYESKWLLPFDELMALVKRAWNTFGGDESFFYKKDGSYFLNTGGWSGNEEIIDAMVHNCCFYANIRFTHNGASWMLEERK